MGRYEVVLEVMPEFEDTFFFGNAQFLRPSASLLLFTWGFGMVK